MTKMTDEDKSAERVKGMVGIIPPGDHDSVEEYHEHLIEKYDSVD